jgi:hypothetical protein
MSDTADRLTEFRAYMSSVREQFNGVVKQCEDKRALFGVKGVTALENAKKCLALSDWFLSLEFKNAIDSSPEADAILDYYFAQCKKLESGARELVKQIEAL